MLRAMREHYGKKKGTQVAYATAKKKGMRIHTSSELDIDELFDQEMRKLEKEFEEL